MLIITEECEQVRLPQRAHAYMHTCMYARAQARVCALERTHAHDFSSRDGLLYQQALHLWIQLNCKFKKKYCILKKGKCSVLYVCGPLSCYHSPNTDNSCLHSSYTVLGISCNLGMSQSTQKDVCRLYVNMLFDTSTETLGNVGIGGRHGEVPRNTLRQYMLSRTQGCYGVI